MPRGIRRDGRSNQGSNGNGGAQPFGGGPGFGAQASPAFGTPTSGGFGAPSNGAFGAPANQSARASGAAPAFGTAVPTTSGAFGAQAAAAPAFGTAVPAAGGAFGAQAAAAPAFGTAVPAAGGAFGAQAAAAPAFGTAVPAASGAFGGAATSSGSAARLSPFGFFTVQPRPQGGILVQPTAAFWAAQVPNASGSSQPFARGAAPSPFGQAAGGGGFSFGAQQVQQAGGRGGTAGTFAATGGWTFGTAQVPNASGSSQPVALAAAPFAFGVAAGGGGRGAASKPAVTTVSQQSKMGNKPTQQGGQAESQHEAKLRVDDAERPPHELLVDMQEAVSAYGATAELVLGNQHVVVRAASDAARDAAYGKCAAIHARAREVARKPPDEWDLSAQPPPGASFVLTTVHQGSAEWQKVADAVSKTMPAAQLTRLERVQSTKLWEKYAQRRAEVAKRSFDGFTANEVWGFHGTKNFPMATICEAGLDFRYGRGGMWGRALYMAADASYSHSYASSCANGERQFFYVRAALGRTIHMASDSSIQAPPTGYDSVYGNTGSWVCMLYDLGQVYPEYIVTYR